MTYHEMNHIIHRWLKDRSARERIYLLIACLLLCMFSWLILWENTYQTAVGTQIADKKILQDKIFNAKIQNTVLKNSFNSVSLKKRKQVLVEQLNDINTRLNAVSTELVSSAAMIAALKNILSHTSGLVLVYLTNTNNSIIIIKNKEQLKKTNLYQHNFILVFESSYFAALDYLKKLENSSFHFYIDNISYTVSEYPTAKIILKIHTISKEKDLIDVS